MFGSPDSHLGALSAMIYFYYFLLLVGLGLYAASLFFIGTGTGQTLFNTGTAFLLVDAVLLLIRLNWKLVESR